MPVFAPFCSVDKLRTIMTCVTLSANKKMKITKSEEEYNMKSIRFLLLTVTSMFIILGILMIVLGISVYSHYHSFSYFYENAKSGRFFTPSILCTLLGFVLILVSSFGFFGSLKRSTFLVNLYAFILTIILITKLVIVILTFTVNVDWLMNCIYIPVSDYAYDAEVQGEIDYMQLSLNCCGSDSYLDYVGLDLNNHSTTVVSNVIDNNLVTVVVPETCCIAQSDDMCVRMRFTGCKEALANLIVQNASVIGVLGLSVMIIQVLGIVFALLLARCIRRMKSEKQMNLWLAKEHQYAERNQSHNCSNLNGETTIVLPEMPRYRSTFS